MSPNVYVTYKGTVDTAYYTRDLLSIPNDHAKIAKQAVKEYIATKKQIPKRIVVTIDLMGNVKAERANWKHFSN